MTLINRRRLLAALGTAPVFGAPVLGSKSVTGENTSQQNSVEISECTQITEPGEYVLVSDITVEEGEWSCLTINSDDVVLDGDGHEIRGGVGIGVDIRESQNIKVRNISIADVESHGIHVIDSEGIEIHDNTVNNIDTSGPGVFVRDSRNVAIHDTVISDVEFQGIKVDNSDGISVHNNTVTEIALNADIDLSDSTDVSVMNNELIDSPGGGIRFSRCDDGLAYGNSSSNSLDDQAHAGGISTWESSNITIENNSIDRPQYGINARTNSSDIVIRGNTILNSTHCAIDAKDNSHDLLVEDNYIDEHGGVEFENYVHNVTIRNNTLVNARGEHYQGSIGVQRGGHSFEIYNNIIINSTKNGIHVTGWDETAYDVSIWNNTVMGVEGVGIFLDSNTHDISAHENYLTGNQNDIEDLNPDENTVEDNILEPVQLLGGEIDREAVTEGEIVSIQAVIQNAAPVGLDYEVRLVIDGETVGVVEHAIPAQKEKTVNFEHVFESPGEYEIHLNDVEIGIVTVEALEEREEGEREADDEVAPEEDDEPEDTDLEADDHEDDPPADEPEEEAMPGFGIGAGVMGIGAAAYMAKRWLGRSEE